MSIVPHDGAAPDAPGRIERGWRDYDETVVPPGEVERVRVLVRLGYYAGAAQALGSLDAADAPAWPEIVAALALEVCDVSDRLLLDTLLGRLP